MYGTSWLETAWKLIIEDKIGMIRWVASAMPLARTPQSRRDSQAANNYAKRFYKTLEGMTPWVSSYKNSILRKKYEAEVDKSGGQIIVMLDANDDPNNPLFEGTHKVSSR